MSIAFVAMKVFFFSYCTFITMSPTKSFSVIYVVLVGTLITTVRTEIVDIVCRKCTFFT